MITITHGGESHTAETTEKAMEIAGKLYEKFGGIPKIVDDSKGGTRCTEGTSEFGALKSDVVAKAQIEKMHAELNAAGITVNTKEQLFETGTRMAESGYSAQRDRKAEFMAAAPVREVAATLTEIVKAEKRHNIEMTAGELSGKVDIIKGRVTLAGFRVTEQALRGLCPRLDSNALAYLLGMRERMADGDRAMIADVLRQELRAARETELKLRVRDTNGDCFAVVSPTYACADAPEALAQIASALPSDARGTWSYDPKSTAWQLRANVFTPTPTNEQAVGEPFQGYAALGGRDGGNGSVYGQGGVMLIRCLNASTYEAAGVNARRVHRGEVMIDVPALFANATKAIDALCKVWGVARTVELEARPTIEGIRLAREIAMAGYFRGMLSDRKSELAGVLPGRTEANVKELVTVFPTEQRNTMKLIKADLANAVTKYAQTFPTPVQRNVEMSVSQWLASDRPVVCTPKLERA